jgi:hypothetical protein
MWHRLAGNVPVIWQTPLNKFNIKIWFVIRLLYGRNYTVIDWCVQNLQPAKECLVKSWYRISRSSWGEETRGGGTTDGPSWRPVTHQTNALCDKESAHNVVLCISAVLLSLTHRYFQNGVRRRSVICSQSQMHFLSHYVRTLMENNETESKYVLQDCVSVHEYDQYILHKNMCKMSRNVNLLKC